MSIEPWLPYASSDAVVSQGRRTLVSAFGDLVRCQACFEPYELVEIFAAPEDQGENDACRHLVREDAVFLTQRFVSGSIATFARPVGGGEIVSLPAEHWEIDDPLPRFATGLFNVDDWANPHAAATHRIFVDAIAFEECLAGLKPLGPLKERELEEVLDPRLRAARQIAAREVEAVLPSSIERDQWDASVGGSRSLKLGDELPTREEVEAVVRFGRQSIYNRMEDDSFPHPIKLGTLSRWKRSEVLAWLEEKAAQRGGAHA